MNIIKYKPAFFRQFTWQGISAFLLVLALGLNGHIASAQNPDSTSVFSIKDAINYAAQHNSNIKMSKFDERIATQETNAVRATGLPQININGALDDRLKIPVQLIPASGFGGGGGDDTAGTGTGGEYIALRFGTKYNASLTGEVTQQIFNPSFWVGLKAAKQSTIYYKQATQKTTEQTAYTIANAYYQVIVVQKQLGLLQSNLENTNKILATTQLQYNNGVAKRVDVSRLQVRANNLQSQVRQLELNSTQAFNALKFQMGMPLENQILLSDTTLNFTQEEPVLSQESESYFDKRIDYQLLQTNLKLRELDRKNNNSKFLPTLSGYANYAYQAQREEFNFFEPNGRWFESSSIGVRLNIPIFDGLQRNARVQQSKINIEKARENINLTKQSINLEVSNALTQYRNTLQRIESENENVKLAQEVFEVSQLEFREGEASSTAVVEAESSLQQAQNTYITTLLDLYVARLYLEKAKGNLLNYINTK